MNADDLIDGDPRIGPDVTFTLPYDDALRLAYMVAFPTYSPRPPQDERVLAVVTGAIDHAERNHDEVS